VQGVTRRIKATIHYGGPLVQALGERVEVGAVGVEAAPLEVFEQGHIRVQVNVGGGATRKQILWVACLQ
jgi:hypothetical protein